MTTVTTLDTIILNSDLKDTNIKDPNLAKYNNENTYESVTFELNFLFDPIETNGSPNKCQLNNIISF